MNNKLFFSLIALFLISLVGWMAYDSRKSMESIRQEGVSRDLLGGSGGGAASIQYLFHFPDPFYTRELSTAQIEALRPSGEPLENNHVYGLTLADYHMDTLYEFDSRKRWFKEEYVLWVENLRVEFTYNTLNVYVSNNYPEGSCPCLETTAHEREHVEIHRRVYAKYQEILRHTVAEAKGIPLFTSPVTEVSSEGGREKVDKIISGVVDPVFNQFRDELNAEQAKIDTRENYAELKRRCKDW